MFRRLYDWTLSLAVHPCANAWLAFIACIESFIFPIPQDAMMLPMMLASPRRAFVIASYALAGSFVGAMIGYGIGILLMDSLGAWIIELYGLQHKAENFQRSYGDNGALILLIGAITPVPFKVITLISGAAKMNFLAFLALSLLGRALRFYGMASLFYFFGASVKGFIERYLNLFGIAFIVLLVGGFVLLKYVL